MRMHNSSNYLMLPEKDSYDAVIPQLTSKAKKIAQSSLDFEMKNISRHNVEYGQKGVDFTFGHDKYHNKPTDYAVRQLASKAGMPYMYLEKLQKSRNPRLRQLAYDNMNILLSNCQQDALFRTVDGCLRGVVSSRYSVFDTDDILDVFTDYFEHKGMIPKQDVAIRGYFLDLDMFNLRLTFNTPVQGLPDEDLFYGLQIVSSDVGRFALRIDFFIYKQLCTNGLTLNRFSDKLFYKRHIGIDKDCFREGIVASFAALPRLMEETSSIITGASRYDLRGLGIMEEVQTMEKQPRAAIKRYFGINDDTLTELAFIARTNYDTSLWGYSNAITQWAQRFSYEKRHEMECKAGELLTNFNRIIKVA